MENTRRFHTGFRSKLWRDWVQQPLLRVPRISDVTGDGVMPATGCIRIAPAALRGVTCVTHFAEGYATPEGPVTQ